MATEVEIETNSVHDLDATTDIGGEVLVDNSTGCDFSCDGEDSFFFMECAD